MKPIQSGNAAVTENDWHVLAGLGVPVILFVFGLWVRHMVRDRRAMKDLSDENKREHAYIRRDMEENHSQLRDKIEKIWRHLVGRD